MKRWTCISAIKDDKRWQFLSEKLTGLGFENEYVPWTAPIEGWQNSPELESFHHVRLSTRTGYDALQTLKVQSSWVTLLGVVDGMIKKDGQWWALCALYESFGKILVKFGPLVDLRGNVFIVGSGAAARVAIAAFFKAGFSRFLLADPNPEEAKKNIAELRRRFLGVTINFIPPEHIVLLPGETSVLVNCTPLENNQLVTELSYLNFLRRPGFVFCMEVAAEPSPLIRDAFDAGANIVPGFEIAAYSDVFWSKWAFGADLDFAEYVQEFEINLAT